jgi:serine phosphatase RsbU (regulator of sigma subunit)
VLSAGRRFNQQIELKALVERVVTPDLTPDELVERILHEAIHADRDMPQDDMTVVALRLGPSVQGRAVRRLSVAVPLPG